MSVALFCALVIFAPSCFDVSYPSTWYNERINNIFAKFVSAPIRQQKKFLSSLFFADNSLMFAVR